MENGFVALNGKDEPKFASDFYNVWFCQYNFVQAGNGPMLVNLKQYF